MKIKIVYIPPLSSLKNYSKNNISKLRILIKRKGGGFFLLFSLISSGINTIFNNVCILYQVQEKLQQHNKINPTLAIIIKYPHQNNF